MMINGHQTRRGFIIVGAPQEDRNFYLTQQKASDDYRASSTPGRFIARVKQTRKNNKQAWRTEKIEGPMGVLPKLTKHEFLFAKDQLIDGPTHDNKIVVRFEGDYLASIVLNGNEVYTRDE